VWSEDLFNSLDVLVCFLLVSTKRSSLPRLRITRTFQTTRTLRIKFSRRNVAYSETLTTHLRYVTKFISIKTHSHTEYINRSPRYTRIWTDFSPRLRQTRNRKISQSTFPKSCYFMWTLFVSHPRCVLRHPCTIWDCWLYPVTRSYGHVRCSTTRIIFKRIFTSVVKYCTRNISVRKHMSSELCMINLRVQSTVKLPTSSLCRNYLFLVSRYLFWSR